MRTIEEQGHVFEEWLTPEQIERDVQQEADYISADYEGHVPLRGSVMISPLKCGRMRDLSVPSFSL